MLMLRGGPATTFETDQRTGNLFTKTFYRATTVSQLLPTKVQVNTPGGCAPPDIASEFGCLTPKVVVSSNTGGNVWGCPPDSAPYNDQYCMRTNSTVPNPPPTMTPTQVFTPPTTGPQMQTCWDGTQVPMGGTCPPVPQSTTHPPMQTPIDQPTPGTEVFVVSEPSFVQRVPWWGWVLGGAAAIVGGAAIVSRVRR